MCTMKAAAVEAFGKPLSMQEWAVVAAGPGQILVKTEACGVCHTDLHTAHGDWPVKLPLPLIPGRFVGTRHEMAGALAFAADGQVRASIELQPLSAVNTIFYWLQDGDVPSRVVIDFPAAS